MWFALHFYSTVLVQSVTVLLLQVPKHLTQRCQIVMTVSYAYNLTITHQVLNQNCSISFPTALHALAAPNYFTHVMPGIGLGFFLWAAWKYLYPSKSLWASHPHIMFSCNHLYHITSVPYHSTSYTVIS